MKFKPRWLFIATLCIPAIIAACTSLPRGGRPTIDPDAAAILKAASDKLAAAGQFTIEGRRSVDPDLVAGRAIKSDAHVELAVKRPNKIVARTTDRSSTRRFYYDGNTVTLFDSGANHYAVVPGARTIDRTIDKIVAEWNFHPPLADLLVSDPYRSLSRRATSGKIVGTQWVRGVKCHHIDVTQEALSWEVWVGEDDSLPRRFVVTFDDIEGAPQMRAEIDRWNLNASLSDAKFEFLPPHGAREIEMVPMR